MEGISDTSASEHNVRTLIIHPDDRSTDFLKTIYAPISSSATIITGGAYHQEDIRRLILSHDRIMMMGHGDAKGLLGIGFDAWPECFRIIDDSMVEVLRDKECIFIWCFANMFVESNNLSGFYTGMFISEVQEAIHFELVNTTEKEIEMSNDIFSISVADMMTENDSRSLSELYAHVMSKYGRLSVDSDVVEYNSSRLRCSVPGELMRV
jgi:hypothetical protein